MITGRQNSQRDEASTSRRLEGIMSVHNAKMMQLNAAIEKELVAKRNYLRAHREGKSNKNNLEEAKKCVVRAHKLKIQSGKYEKLYSACESMKDSVDAARTLRETVMALQDVSSVFKGTTHTDWPQKMQNISDQFEVSVPVHVW